MLAKVEKPQPRDPRHANRDWIVGLATLSDELHVRDPERMAITRLIPHDPEDPHTPNWRPANPDQLNTQEAQLAVLMDIRDTMAADHRLGRFFTIAAIILFVVLAALNILASIIAPAHAEDLEPARVRAMMIIVEKSLAAEGYNVTGFAAGDVPRAVLVDDVSVSSGAWLPGRILLNVRQPRECFDIVLVQQLTIDAVAKYDIAPANTWFTAPAAARELATAAAGYIAPRSSPCFGNAQAALRLRSLDQ